jgi:hypothetical protein
VAERSALEHILPGFAEDAEEEYQRRGMQKWRESKSVQNPENF